MAVLDSVARSVTSKLVRKFGKKENLSLLRRSAAAYSTTTGTAEVTETTLAISGVVWTARKGERAGVEAGDYRVLVAGSAVDPAPDTSDRLSLDGDEYQVVDVEEQWSGDEIAFYVISGRG